MKGSKTEGAGVLLVESMGYRYSEIRGAGAEQSIAVCHVLLVVCSRVRDTMPSTLMFPRSRKKQQLVQCLHDSLLTLMTFQLLVMSSGAAAVPNL